LLCLCNTSISLFGQSTISPSGGESTGNAGSVSYTIGQIGTNPSNANSAGILTQGVQQPFEILIITGIEEAEGIKLQFCVFPNPCKNDLFLKVENFSFENIFYLLIDNNGKILAKNKITETETKISIDNLPSSVFYVEIKDINNKGIKTFKIIKNR
jgi:hypothetical protein